MKKMYWLALLVLTSCSTPAPRPLIRASAATSRKIIELSFTGTGTYTWLQSGGLASAMSIEMSFVNSTNNNTFYLGYRRNNVLHDIVTATSANMHTLMFYLPSEKYCKPGDRWVYTNTATNSAVLNINVNY